MSAQNSSSIPSEKSRDEKDEKAKKPYLAPLLSEFGRVSELTGKSLGTPDQGGNRFG